MNENYSNIKGESIFHLIKNYLYNVIGNLIRKCWIISIITGAEAAKQIVRLLEALFPKHCKKCVTFNAFQNKKLDRYFETWRTFLVNSYKRYLYRKIFLKTSISVPFFINWSLNNGEKVLISFDQKPLSLSSLFSSLNLNIFVLFCQSPLQEALLEINTKLEILFYYFNVQN
jgi:hypothetical protein